MLYFATTALPATISVPALTVAPFAGAGTSAHVAVGFVMAMTTIPFAHAFHPILVISNPSGTTVNTPAVQSAVSPHALRTTTPAGAPTARTCARYRFPLVSPVTTRFVASTPVTSSFTFDAFVYTPTPRNVTSST